MAIEREESMSEFKKIEELSRTFIDNLSEVKSQSANVMASISEAHFSLKPNKGFEIFVNETLRFSVTEEIDRMI